MKIGELIKCADEKDLKQTLKDLSTAGFHAVRVVDYDETRLRITSVPETEYLVGACDQNGRAQNTYCSTGEEAEEIYEELARAYEFVEILKGYPGEWESISRTW